MKKITLAVICLFLAACGTFDIQVQIVPRVTRTPLVTVTPTALAVVPPTGTPTASPEPTATPDPFRPGGPLTIVSIQMSDSNSGWGVESSGHIVKTSDAGWTWANVNPFDGFFDAHSLFALNNETAWAIPARPQAATVVWHTQDGGTTWEASEPLGLSDGNYSLLGLQFPNARSGWLLLLSNSGAQGSHVLLYRSADGGDTWQPMNALLEGDAQSYLPDTNTSMVFFDGQTGWLGGWWGKDAPSQWMVMTTNNGGLKWSPEPIALPAGDDMSCDAQPALGLQPGAIAVEVTCTQARDQKYFYHRLFYLSTMSARAWRSWKLTGQFLSVDFLNPSQGWMMVSSDIPRLNDLQYTQDGGKNWVAINQVSWKEAHFDFVNGKEGWAIVGNGFETALVHTESGGKIWIQVRPVLGDS